MKGKTICNILETYSLANVRVSGERTGAHGSSHSGSGLISNGAGFAVGMKTSFNHGKDVGFERKDMAEDHENGIFYSCIK